MLEPCTHGSSCKSSRRLARRLGISLCAYLALFRTRSVSVDRVPNWSICSDASTGRVPFKSSSRVETGATTTSHSRQGLCKASQPHSGSLIHPGHDLRCEERTCMLESLKSSDYASVTLATEVFPCPGPNNSCSLVTFEESQEKFRRYALGSVREISSNPMSCAQNQFLFRIIQHPTLQQPQARTPGLLVGNNAVFT